MFDPNMMNSMYPMLAAAQPPMPPPVAAPSPVATPTVSVHQGGPMPPPPPSTPLGNTGVGVVQPPSGLGALKPTTLQDYLALSYLTSSLGGSIGSMFKPFEPPKPVPISSGPGQGAPSTGSQAQLLAQLSGNRRQRYKV